MFAGCAFVCGRTGHVAVVALQVRRFVGGPLENDEALWIADGQ